LKRRPLALILFLALSASTLQGCAWRSKPFHPAPPAAPPASPEAPSPETVPPAVPPGVPEAMPPAISVADRQFTEGMKALQEGGYERALELFSGAWKEQPGHPGVAREFDAAVIGLKKNGDAAYDKGMWEEAGKRWTGTLRFIDHPAANPRGYPFTRSELRTKLDKLTAALAEKALKEYRQGEVSAAIADWKTILSYDPKNVEATLSLRTATKQLETLKKMPPGK